MRIVKIHGCSGAGKTTVVRKIMKMADFTRLPALGKPEAYMSNSLSKDPVYVLGSYENTCGGMDVVGDSAKVIKLLDHYSQKGHIIFEGLLQSTYYGKLGEHSKAWDRDYIYAFLDTPIELCLERVVARRAASNRNNKFNPELTREKHETIDALKRKLLATTSHHVLILKHDDNPAQQVLDILNEE